jgi:hypothetical protein
MKIERDKVYLTRKGGYMRRVICVDAPGPYPVIAIDDSGNTSRRTVDGLHPDRGSDLVAEYIPPKRPGVVYVNDYGSRGVSAYTDEERTRRVGGSSVIRLAVKYIEVTPEVEAALKKGGVEY